MTAGLNLNSKMRLGLAAILALTAALAMYANVELSRVRTLHARLSSSRLPAALRIGEIQAMMQQDRLLVLKYIYAGAREEKSADEAEAIAMETRIGLSLGEYGKSMVRNEDRALFHAAHTAWKELSRIRNASVLPLSRGMKQAEADEADKRMLAPAFEGLMRSMDALVAWNRSAGEKADAELKAAIETAKIGILGGTLALALLAGTIGVSLGRAAASARRAGGSQAVARMQQASLPEAAASTFP